MRISSQPCIAPHATRVPRRPAEGSSGATHTPSPERAALTRASQTEAIVDGGLVRRFNAGDEAAFADIVTRHHARIMALALRCLRNRADAEEIVQDTFIRAHRGLARFRGESSLATWLHRIGFNLARNRYWYYHRRRRHLTLSLDSPLSSETTGTFADLVACGEPNPAQRATADEFVALVAVCMGQLDEGHREILVLRNQLHRTYEEIAQSLGINPGTVKSRIARARERLRDFMVAACPEYASESNANDWFEPIRTSVATH